MFAQNGFNSIKFGIVWQLITPYCHCKEPLKIKHYIFGALMPGILMGLLPTLYALIFDNIWLFIFGVFFTFAAAGDALMVYILRNETMNTYVQDHPSEVGCYLYKNEANATE
jgi:hypothetical protein